MKIGCIGLGNMGSGICKNIINAGYEVCVFDLDKANRHLFEGTAQLANSSEDLFNNSDLIFLSLPSSIEVEKISAVFLNIGVTSKTVIDLSTSFPLSSQKIYQQFKVAGGDFADASLTGSPIQAASGELIVTFGGDQDVFDRVESIVLSFAKHFHYIGDSGAGNLAKLVNNYLAIMYVALYAEIFPLADKLNIDSKRLFEVIGDSGVGCRMYQVAAKKIVEKTYEPAFALGLAEKDLGYVKRLFESVNVQPAILEGGLQFIAQALEKGLGKDDVTTVAIIQRELLGLNN